MDAQTSFKDGDVVQLKSGGPLMTVAGRGTTAGYHWCVWFDKDGEQQGSEFNPMTLKPASPS